MRVPSLGLLMECDVNFVRAAWNRLSSVPGGKSLFSMLIGRVAKYTGTIDADVEELSSGYAVVTMRDRAAVRNHLRSVHAVALVNLAELAGSVALAYAMPDDARFIVTGLRIEYVKKARGRIRAVSACPIPATSDRQEYQVPVVLTDKHGDEVARASLKTLVSSKKHRTKVSG